MKILRYVQEGDGTVTLDAIPKPEKDFPTVEEIVRTALESEQAVSRMINDLVALAESENDYATRSFLNWFVDEQVEEVSSMTSLLTLLRLAAGNMLQVEARVQQEMMSEH